MRMDLHITGIKHFIQLYTTAKVYSGNKHLKQKIPGGDHMGVMNITMCQASSLQTRPVGDSET